MMMDDEDEDGVRDSTVHTKYIRNAHTQDMIHILLVALATLGIHCSQAVGNPRPLSAGLLITVLLVLLGTAILYYRSNTTSVQYCTVLLESIIVLTTRAMEDWRDWLSLISY